EQSGRILTPEAWDQCTLFDVNYQPARMSIAELENGFRDLGRRIYDSGFIEERRRRFFQRQDVLRRTGDS
ncbi:MAG: B12-binding domain-containing radical SAM protein, partial [Verrucomicrobiota bacterium]